MKEGIVIVAPISDNYWKPGDKALIRGKRIKINGCWFNYNKSFKLKNIRKVKNG
jgi:hypothetical protein